MVINDMQTIPLLARCSVKSYHFRLIEILLADCSLQKAVDAFVLDSLLVFIYRKRKPQSKQAHNMKEKQFENFVASTFATRA